MSRILVVLPYALEPPMGGGKMAVIHRCAALAQHHRLFLLTGGEASGQSLPVEGIFEQTWHVPYRPWGGRALINQLLRMALSPRPFSSSFLGQAAGQLMARIIAEHRIEVVLLEHSYSAVQLLPHLPKVGRPRIGIIEQNVEHDVWLDLAGFPQIRLAFRLLARWEARRLRRILPRVYAAVDGVAFISGRDRETASRIFPHPNMHTCECILPVPAEPKTVFEPTGRICYWGTLGYFPNFEGMLWFTREVWPLVRAAQPEAELLVFGGKVTGRAQAALEEASRTPGITFAGAVTPSEMDRLACASDGFISPVRLGSGVKLKNLVALGLGLPMVATGSSMAGNLAEPGRDFLLADTAGDFAQRVLDLGARELQQTLAMNARAVFERRYTAAAATPGWLRFVDSLRR